MASPKFHIAIVGGGIGGVAAAICFARHPDISVEIFEQAPEFGEVGAGIGVWPRIWKTLARLGLDEDLARLHAVRPTYDLTDVFIFRKADQPKGEDFYKLTTQGSFLRYHRPDVLKVLIDHLPERVPTHFGRRLNTHRRLPNGKIELQFDDGLVTTCDILIGSDGVRSTVRRDVLTEQAQEATAAGRPDEADAILRGIEPSWTGIVAYRALVPTERLLAYRDAHPEEKVRVPEHNSIPVMYMGQHVNVVVYPISSGRLINVAAFHAKDELAGTPFSGPWVSQVNNQELLDAHAGWESELQAILKVTFLTVNNEILDDLTIIKCIDSPSRWAVHTVRKLKTWVHGRVVLQTIRPMRCHLNKLLVLVKQSKTLTFYRLF